jgi:hypothetical protein
MFTFMAGISQRTKEGLEQREPEEERVVENLNSTIIIKSSI